MMSKLALLWRALMASLVLAMLWLAAPAMADELRLGYVDTERVYREATAAVKAQQRLKAEFAPREAELADMARHARELKQTLDAGKLSDAERRTRERELQALDRDFRPNSWNSARNSASAAPKNLPPSSSAPTR